MLNDIIKLAELAVSYGSSRQERLNQHAVMLRALRMELSTNLNLLNTVVNKLTEGNNGEKLNQEHVDWLLNVLSTSSIKVFLLTDPKFVDELDTELYASEAPKRYRSLSKNLEWLLIKIEEMKAISKAPDSTPLPTLNWSVRFSHLKDAHLQAVRRLKLPSEQRENGYAK